MVDLVLIIIFYIAPLIMIVLYRVFWTFILPYLPQVERDAPLAYFWWLFITLCPLINCIVAVGYTVMIMRCIIQSHYIRKRLRKQLRLNLLKLGSEQ